MTVRAAAIRIGTVGWWAGAAIGIAALGAAGIYFAGLSRCNLAQSQLDRLGAEAKRVAVATAPAPRFSPDPSPAQRTENPALLGPMDGPQADSLDEDFGRYMAVLQSLPGYTEASREDRECGERKQLVPVAIAGVAMTIALWALVFIGTGGFWKPPRS